MRWFALFIFVWSFSCVSGGETEFGEFTEARQAQHKVRIHPFPGEGSCGRAISEFKRGREALRQAKERYDAAALNVIRVVPEKWSSICLDGVDFDRMEFWETDQTRRMCAAKTREEYLQARGAWDHWYRYIP